MNEGRSLKKKRAESWFWCPWDVFVSSCSQGGTSVTHILLENCYFRRNLNFGLYWVLIDTKLYEILKNFWNALKCGFIFISCLFKIYWKSLAVDLDYAKKLITVKLASSIHISFCLETSDKDKEVGEGGRVSWCYEWKAELVSEWVVVRSLLMFFLLGQLRAGDAAGCEQCRTMG